MAAIDWATCHHPIRHKQATCQETIHRPTSNQHLPRVVRPCQLSPATCQETIHGPTSNQHLPCVIQPYQLIPATCRMALPRQHLYGLYGLYSQHIFFCMFDDLNRTRYLSHMTSI
jgi:hypothetical protein